MSDRITVSADGLDGAFGGFLEAFAAEVREGAADAVEGAARSCRADLARTSPRKTGRYARGWRVEDDSGAEGPCAVVRQAAKPSLTHLLENGHERFEGGRPTGSRTPAIPHIGPAAERAAAKLVRELKR